MAKSKEQLLEELRLSKAGRRSRDLEKLLKLYEWSMRKATRERSLWKKGTRTYLVPNDHGRDLPVGYVSELISEIEAAEEEEILRQKEESR